jgi:hypothetical protein
MTDRLVVCFPEPAGTDISSIGGNDLTQLIPRRRPRLGRAVGTVRRPHPPR